MSATTSYDSWKNKKCGEIDDRYKVIKEMWQNINDESDGRVCHSYKSFVGKLFPKK